MNIRLEPIRFEVNGVRAPGDMSVHEALTGTKLPLDKIMIEARDGHSGRKWAITYRGMVLDKKGNWEWEPMPSSRTDAFLKRTRFDTVAIALEILHKFSKSKRNTKATNLV